MKVLLKQDVEGVGKRTEIVNVSEGYFRNYLAPKALAVAATDQNIKIKELAAKKEQSQLAKRQQEFEQIAKQLDGVELELTKKANETGHLFGSINPIEIATLLNSKYKYQIDPKWIHLEAIKQLGEYQAQVTLPNQVKFNLKLLIKAE